MTFRPFASLDSRLALFALILVVLIGALAIVRGVWASGSDDPARRATASFTVKRGAFTRTLRMTGLVESIRFHNVAAPRLVGITGPGSNTLIITKLTPSGSRVETGQVLVEFDRQNQLKAAIDKRTEHRDLEEQIRKKRAEHEQARANDDADLAVAANAVENAQLEMKKNEYLGRIDDPRTPEVDRPPAQPGRVRQARLGPGLSPAICDGPHPAGHRDETVDKEQSRQDPMQT